MIDADITLQEVPIRTRHSAGICTEVLVKNVCTVLDAYQNLCTASACTASA